MLFLYLFAVVLFVAWWAFSIVQLIDASIHLSISNNKNIVGVQRNNEQIKFLMVIFSAALQNALSLIFTVSICLKIYTQYIG